MAKLKAAHDQSEEGEHIGDVAHNYDSYIGIVNCYIKNDAHSEINIGSDIKLDIIVRSIRFEAYASLDPVSQTTTTMCAWSSWYPRNFLAGRSWVLFLML